jgi:hypothetical protein
MMKKETTKYTKDANQTSNENRRFDSVFFRVIRVFRGSTLIGVRES